MRICPIATATGAGQASAMHVTELEPSLEMLGRVRQEFLLDLLELLPGEQSLLEPVSYTHLTLPTSDLV